MCANLDLLVENACHHTDPPEIPPHEAVWASTGAREGPNRPGRAEAVGIAYKPVGIQMTPKDRRAQLILRPLSISVRSLRPDLAPRRELRHSHTKRDRRPFCRRRYARYLGAPQQGWLPAHTSRRQEHASPFPS